MSLPKSIVCILLVAALAACGGNKASQSAANANAQPAATTGAASSANAMAGAPGAMVTASPMAEGPVKPVPGNVNCNGVPPVWANPRSHVYHEPSDRLYGRTKHGMYMCVAQATAAGYHKAHTHNRPNNTMMNTETTPEPAAT